MPRVVGAPLSTSNRRVRQSHLQGQGCVVFLQDTLHIHLQGLQNYTSRLLPSNLLKGVVGGPVKATQKIVSPAGDLHLKADLQVLLQPRHHSTAVLLAVGHQLPEGEGATLLFGRWVFLGAGQRFRLDTILSRVEGPLAAGAGHHGINSS